MCHRFHVVLLLPFAFHVWRNWRLLLGYSKRGTLVIPLVLSLAVAIPFAASGLGGGVRGGNPAFRAMALMTQARLTDLAPVLKMTPDELITSLKQRGVDAHSANETLDAVATASDRNASDLLQAVMPAR